MGERALARLAAVVLDATEALLPIVDVVAEDLSGAVVDAVVVAVVVVVVVVLFQTFRTNAFAAPNSPPAFFAAIRHKHHQPQLASSS